MRPFIDPRTEPLTVIMNGMTDNRFYLQQETRQFTISAPQSNLNELVRQLAQKKRIMVNEDRYSYVTTELVKPLDS